jgi:hypothetical protein
MLSLPKHIKSLSLDYQDLSKYCPYFSEGLTELRISRREDLKINSKAREMFSSKLPSSLQHLFLDETLWIYRSKDDSIFDLIPHTSQELIVNLKDFSIEALPLFFTRLPLNIKTLNLDFSEREFLAFYEMNHLEKQDYINKFPPHITDYSINSLFFIKRLLSGKLQFNEDPGIQLAVFQKTLALRPNFFDSIGVVSSDLEQVGVSLEDKLESSEEDDLWNYFV